MANFQNSFSGKGTGVILPSGDKLNQAQQGMNDMILSAEKLKYDVFKKNEEEFLKNAHIDPVFVLSDSARKVQYDFITNYNQKYGKILKQYGGNIPDPVKQQMATEKDFLVMQQQKMQSDMQQALQERDIVEKDGGRTLDPVEWYQKKWLPFIKTGEYDTTPLAPKARSIEEVFGNSKISTAGAYEEPDIANPLRIRSVSSNKKDVGIRIADRVFNDEAVKRHALQEWSDLPQEEKDRFLDVNGDKIISEEERKSGDVITKSLDNPIIKAYVDKHWGNLVDVKFVNKAGIRKTTTTVEPSNVGSSEIKLFPGKQTPNQRKTYGDQEYSQTQSFSFGNNPTISGIPTRGGKAINADWTDDEISSGSINGRLVLYDPVKKVFLVESVVASESADQKSRTLLEIPEENITDFGNIPIEYVGQKMTIAEYKKALGGESTSQPTKGGLLDNL